MTQISWSATTSGSWTTAADWSTGVTPIATDDVLIAVAGITVTASAAGLAVNSITTTSSTLAVTAGMLSVGSYARFNGAYTQSGGTLSLAGQGANFLGTATLSGGLILSQASQLLSSGGFSQTGGVLALAGQGGAFSGNLVQTAGTIRMMSGALDLYGANNSLSGTISGAGTLVEAGSSASPAGITTLGSNTVLSIAHVSVTSGVLALSSSLTYGGYLSATSSGTVLVGSNNTLTLNGRAQLGADFSGGTILANGGGQMNGLVLDNGAMLDIGTGSTLNLTAQNNGPGAVTLKASSQIMIAAATGTAQGGTLTLTGNDTINDTSNNATITDGGLLIRSGGAGLAEIAPSFAEANTGTVAVNVGTLDFSGASNYFAGIATGNGTLSLGASNNGSLTSDVFDPAFTLATAGFVLTGPNTQLFFSFATQYTYAGAWDQSGGVFLLGNQAQTLTLNLTGNVVLDGGVIKSSAGTIATTGFVNLGANPAYGNGVAIEGFTHFNVEAPSTVYQTALIQLGASSSSKPQALIAHGAAWYMEDASSINGAYGTLTNLGVLEKLDGAAPSTIQSTLLNAGVLTVASSSLLLSGSGTLGGTVNGAGLLAFEGTGTYVLGGASAEGTLAALNVAHILVDNTQQGPQSSVVQLNQAITYAGAWAQHGGTVQLNNNTLTLSGTSSLDGGTIAGPGVLNATGALTLGGSPNSQLSISSGATVMVSKNAIQSTDITVAGGAGLTIAKGAGLTMADTVNIFGSGTLSVLGSLTDNATGLGTITATTMLSGGNVAINHGELSFIGSVVGSGSLVVHAGAELDLMSAFGTAGAMPTVNLASGQASLLLGDASAFNGVIGGFVANDFIEISGLASGVITDALDSTGKTLTISDSSNHTFTLDFAQAQSLSSLVVSDGPHGYIGVFHS